MNQNNATKCVECFNALQCIDCSKAKEQFIATPESVILHAKLLGWKTRYEHLSAVHDNLIREGCETKEARDARWDCLLKIREVNEEIGQALQQFQSDRRVMEEVEEQAVAYILTKRIKKRLHKLCNEVLEKDGQIDEPVNSFITQFLILVGLDFLSIPVKTHETILQRLTVELLNIVGYGFGYTKIVEHIARSLYEFQTYPGLPIKLMTPLIVTPIENGVTYTTSDGVSHTLYI